MRRLLLAALALVVLVGGAAAAYVLYKKHQSRNIHGSPSVEFVTTQTVPHRSPAELRRVPWPTYGRDDAWQRVAEEIHLRPPFRKLWVAGGTSLLEFPPAVGYGRLYLSNNTGTLFALGARNGRRAWVFATHRCTAASPDVHASTVFASFMNRGSCNQTRSGLDGVSDQGRGVPARKPHVVFAEHHPLASGSGHSLVPGAGEPGVPIQGDQRDPGVQRRQPGQNGSVGATRGVVDHHDLDRLGGEVRGEGALEQRRPTVGGDDDGERRAHRGSPRGAGPRGVAG